ncbi:alginate export family protein [Aliifodinibius sp. S!AR15-10]|uniref:hypothetical protein n=1 Tax=Aliifodinibius sp. S!AR15-10 TaxID=2950437 RepID=UPI002856D42F|nr:hypothetical protein [Aliifodinibius sp. S!AR15-10]MDR8394145.1 alginate export family protein [Aliifodinibius sp. S!AR15-10]
MNYKTCTKTLSILLLLACFLTDYAFAQFTLSGELRPRTELRHGYKTLPSSGSNAAFFTEQRSRLNLDYTNDSYELKFSVQDVRIWGSQDQLNTTDGLFSVHEAWGEVNLDENFALKAGRQELVYDDQRILGSVGWTAQGRSHDALLLKYEEEAWALHTGFAFNQTSANLFETTYSGVNNYKTLQYLWYHRDLETTSFSVLGLNNGVQSPGGDVYFTQTMGFTGSQAISDLKLNGTAFYQAGTDPGGTDVGAMMASLSLNYSGFTLGADYLSGTGSNQQENHSFNPLYGTHHKFYGFMDYFYVGHPHSQQAASHNNNIGLVDLYLKKSTSIASGTAISAALHEFFSPVSIVDPGAPSETLSTRLGTEVDLVFSHALSEEVKIMAGYSHLFATSSMEALKGGSNGQVANWAWLMLSFNPVFLSM